MISVAVVGDKTCHICLANSDDVIMYQGSACTCRLTLHKACLDSWHNVRPGACPICLKGASERHALLGPVFIERPLGCLGCIGKLVMATFCCCCVTPFMMLFCCCLNLL